MLAQGLFWCAPRWKRPPVPEASKFPTSILIIGCNKIISAQLPSHRWRPTKSSGGLHQVWVPAPCRGARRERRAQAEAPWLVGQLPGGMCLKMGFYLQWHCNFFVGKMVTNHSIWKFFSYISQSINVFLHLFHFNPLYHILFFGPPTWPGGRTCRRLVKATMDNEHEDLGIGLQLLEA